MLSLADLDATMIGAFLQYLEDDRGNGSATRNARLAAIHSLFNAQSGLRVSELTALTCQDAHLGAGAHVRCCQTTPPRRPG